MIQSAVPRAARQESQSVTETAAMGPGARCSPQYVLNAVRIPKCHLNPVVISQFTAVTAIAQRQTKYLILEFN